jgi:hypothetical protein
MWVPKALRLRWQIELGAAMVEAPRSHKTRATEAGLAAGHLRLRMRAAWFHAR